MKDHQLKDEFMFRPTRSGYAEQVDRMRRNIRIGSRRTSIKLEPEMWEALGEICALTEKSLNQICTEVYAANNVDNPDHPDDIAGCGNFTSELRVFILDFFRAAARQGGLEHMQPSITGSPVGM
ncbi:MAG: ribbon-helix-helix domain-containing protein [Rhodospirillaceae bacterium]|nr:ribbon-helix-helix domain-containing protein [Rhodospirillaceae bacterium]